MTCQKMEGGCQCGSVRYSVVGAPVLAAICHCSMCRRAHAAPAVAWAMYAQGQVQFTHGAPKSYASSAEAHRGFCGNCGTQLSFTADFLPGLIDITIGSLDQPEAVQPTLHSRHLAWAEFADNLPRHPQFPPME